MKVVGETQDAARRSMVTSDLTKLIVFTAYGTSSSVNTLSAAFTRFMKVSNVPHCINI